MAVGGPRGSFTLCPWRFAWVVCFPRWTLGHGNCRCRAFDPARANSWLVVCDQQTLSDLEYPGDHRSRCRRLSGGNLLGRYPWAHRERYYRRDGTITPGAYPSLYGSAVYYVAFTALFQARQRLVNGRKR